MPVAPAPIVSKLHVFLSYLNDEVAFADALKTHLVGDFIGLVEVFLATDTTSVAAGTKWLEEIVGGLQRAQLHLVVCSKISVHRPWVNFEVGGAAVRGVPIIPLFHSGLLAKQLPVPLSQSEGGSLTDAAFLEKLYLQVARLIGSAVPAVDFAAIAEEFREIETKVAALVDIEQACARVEPSAALQTEQIRDPKVMCVTSPQFRELGYQNQLQLVLDAFPKAIAHQFVLDSADLTRVLLEQQVDIVHIAGFVCPRGGDLYFSRVELPAGLPVPGEETDRIAPAALVALLEKARTRLVVLGASASLVLGAQLLPVTHVIAARDLVSPAAMASWVGTFYKSLPKDSLAAAFKLASEVSQAPMVLYARQGRPR